MVKGNVQKESRGRTLQQFSSSISSKFFEWYFYWDFQLYKLITNWYKLIIPVTFSNSSTRDTFFIFQCLTLYFNLAQNLVISLLHTLSRAGEMRFTLGEGMECLKSIIGHDTIVSFSAFQWLVFSFPVFFSGFAVKARIASHHFNKEFILPQS